MWLGRFGATTRNQTHLKSGMRGMSALPPESRQKADMSACPLCAINGLMQCSKAVKAESANSLDHIVGLLQERYLVEGLKRLARGPGCRRYPGRRSCREAQAPN